MRAILLAVILSTATVSFSQQPDYKSDPKFQKAWKEGEELSRHSNQLIFAIDAFRKANKIANGQCDECLRKMLALQFKVGAYKDAIGTAAALEAIARTPKEKAYAEGMRASAIFTGAGDKPKPAQLEEADAAYKASLSLNPNSKDAWYEDGRVLAMLNKDEEAKAAFQQFLDHAPVSDKYATRAEHFIENPAMAREKMAPAVKVVTAQGEEFNLDDMGGKVVLIDFWATWCGPCNEELPNVKRIAKDFAGQPFVLLSVSWDADANKWQEFINKNEMTWNQYRDKDHELSKAFGVEAIPHYFTIDSDGVLKAEVLGSGNDVEGKLKKLVAKAKAAQAAQAAKAATSSGN